MSKLLPVRKYSMESQEPSHQFYLYYLGDGSLNATGAAGTSASSIPVEVDASAAVQASVIGADPGEIQPEPCGPTASVDELIIPPSLSYSPFATPQEDPVSDANLSAVETSVLGVTALMAEMGDDSVNSLDRSGVEVAHADL